MNGIDVLLIVVIVVIPLLALLLVLVLAVLVVSVLTLLLGALLDAALCVAILVGVYGLCRAFTSHDFARRTLLARNGWVFWVGLECLGLEVAQLRLWVANTFL